MKKKQNEINLEDRPSPRALRNLETDGCGTRGTMGPGRRRLGDRACQPRGLNASELDPCAEDVIPPDLV